MGHVPSHSSSSVPSSSASLLSREVRVNCKHMMELDALIQCVYYMCKMMALFFCLLWLTGFAMQNRTFDLSAL